MKHHDSQEHVPTIHNETYQDRQEQIDHQYDKIPNEVLAQDHPDMKPVHFDCYYVYWDSECQCELFRGTYKECFNIDRNTIFGGGNYNIYPCIEGYRIVNVKPRNLVYDPKSNRWVSTSKMQITLQEE